MILTYQSKARFALLAGGLVLGFLPAQVGCTETRSYFPRTEFRDLEAYNADEPKAWSNYLSLFKEPILFNDRSVVFAIRVTLAPAFSDGLIIRIQKNRDGSIEGTVKHLARQTQVLATGTFAANNDDLDAVEAVLNDEKFWLIGNRQTVVTTDGIQLLVEVKEGGRYHVAYTNGPIDTPLWKIAKTMARVAHTSLPGM